MKFTVGYSTIDAGESVMTIEMTEAGLAELNTSKAVYSDAGMVNSGFSDCTMRIRYTAKMNSNGDLVYGDKGNDNRVVLTWKRSSQNYYDTLVDDCHVFTYGIDLTKVFNDGQGNFKNVTFLIQNKTDGYYVKAALDQATGIYYVTEHVTDKKDATNFVPVTVAGKDGKIVVMGLEDDSYVISELKTDNGYTLLKNTITVDISRADTANSCTIYESDALGLIQNDPRYAEKVNSADGITNHAQKHLEHKLVTASATVDGKKVTMLESNGSKNAEAPLSRRETSGTLFGDT